MTRKRRMLQQRGVQRHVDSGGVLRKRLVGFYEGRRWRSEIEKWDKIKRSIVNNERLYYSIDANNGERMSSYLGRPQVLETEK